MYVKLLSNKSHHRRHDHHEELSLLARSILSHQEVFFLALLDHAFQLDRWYCGMSTEGRNSGARGDLHY
jgi:hypothetical protein